MATPPFVPEPQDYDKHDVAVIVVQVGSQQPIMYTRFGNGRLQASSALVVAIPGVAEALVSAETHARATGSVGAWYGSDGERWIAYWQRPDQSDDAELGPNGETVGWTSTPGLVAGSHQYTHPQYTGWKIYQTQTGGAATVYRDGDTVGEYDSLPEAIEMITDNVVPDNRRVDLDGNIPIRRRETISAVDYEKAVRGIAEKLDPSAFDGSDPSADGQAGNVRRDAARETARQMLKATGAPEPTGTVDPDREISADEFKALVAIETAERLAVRAHRLLGEALEGPISNAPARIATAQWLLSALTSVTSTRTCTAVKQQDVSDRIAAEARANFVRIMSESGQ